MVAVIGAMARDSSRGAQQHGGNGSSPLPSIPLHFLPLKLCMLHNAATQSVMAKSWQRCEAAGGQLQVDCGGTSVTQQ